MISLESWFTTQFASQLTGPAGVLLVVCLQVALLAGLSQLVCSLIKPAAIRYHLWHTSALLVLTLLPFHLIVGGWPVTIAPSSPSLTVTLNAQPQELPPTNSLWNEQPALVAPTTTASPVVADAPLANKTVDREVARPVIPTISRELLLVIVLVAAYCCIAIWLAARTILATRKLLLQARTAQPACENIQRLTEELAVEMKLKRLPSVGLVERTSMPLVIGFFKPTILLPSDFQDWHSDGQRAVLAHELAHIARRDVWGQLISRTMCCLYWFHPGSWWIERRLSETRELATDQRALAAGQSSHAYAHALLNVLNHLQSTNTPGLALPIAAATPMRQRINYLLTATTRKQTQTRWLSTALTIVLVAVACVSSVRIVISTLVNNQQPTGPASQPALVLTAPIAVQQTSPRRPEDNDLFVRMVECDVSTVAADKAGAKVTISGRVLSNGKAVAGATVVFRESSQIYLNPDRDMKFMGYADGDWTPTPDVLARTITNADGSFAFQNIAVSKTSQRDPWRGDIVAIHPQSGIGWMDLAIKENVDLKKENVSLELEPLADIRGTVLNPAQQPLADAEVSIHLFQMGPKPQPNPTSFFKLETMFSQLTVSARTDNKGQFVFKNVPRDMTAQLLARHADYIHGVAAVTSLDVKTITPGSLSKEYFRDVQSSPCKIVLNQGILVTGQILDKTSRQPLPEVKLAIDPSIVGWKTDSSGRFKLLLPRPQKSSDSQDRATSRSSGVLLRLEPQHNSGYLETLYRYDPDAIGRDQPLDIGLERGVPIRGKVVADDGQPIKKAVVGVWNYRSDGITYAAATNNEGVFELLAPPGKLQLLVAGGAHGYQLPPSEAMYYDENEADMTSWPLVSVDTSDRKPQTNIDIVVPRVPPIQCLVTFADGTPAANASVVVKDNPRRPREGILWGLLRDSSDIHKTDAQGRVSLRARKPTPNAAIAAKLMVDNNSYQCQVPLKQALDSKGIAKVVIEKLPVLSGRVLSSGEPTAGAIVRIVDSPFSNPRPASGTQIETITNQLGEFRVDVLPGDYVVSVDRVPGYAARLQGAKEVKRVDKMKYDAGDLVVDFPVQPLSGRLLDPTGKPVANAQVRPRPLDPNAPFFPEESSVAVTDANGVFKFPALLATDYDLHISLDKGRGQTFNGVDQRLRPGKAQVDVVIGK